MRHSLIFLLVGILALCHGWRPERSEAHTALKHTPVTGSLASGGTFQGRLSVHALRVTPSGDLTALARVSGQASTAPGVVQAVPSQPVTASVLQLDRRGSCQMAVVQPRPLVLPQQSHAVTFEPVLVGLQKPPSPEAGGPTTLCALPPLQE